MNNYHVGFKVLTAVEYNAMYSIESQSAFWRNTSPKSSGLKNKLSKKPA
jgi:hypothetical protein